jgi:hypothetical protein
MGRVADISPAQAAIMSESRFKKLRVVTAIGSSGMAIWQEGNLNALGNTECFSEGLRSMNEEL